MAKTVLNILGFHRSGTSALAGQLHALGIPLGFENQERSEENPRGFFEHPLVRDINERVLGQLNSAWFDWSLTPGALATRVDEAKLDSLRDEAIAFLDNHFADHDRLLLKDPRMMRLAWFWEPLFEAAGIVVDDLIILRHPAECAASQVARAAREPEFYRAITTAEGMSALWCADHLMLLDHLACEKRTPLIVWHQALMMQPEHTLDSIIEHLNLDLGEHDLYPAKSAIDSGLYRQKHQKPEGPWGEIAEELFFALQSTTKGGVLVFDAAKSEYRSVLRRLRTMQAIAAPAADPINSSAARARDKEAAVTKTLMKTLKLVGLAANRVPADQLEPIVAEIEGLITSMGRRGLFLGVLATALIRSGRKIEATRVLEEILDAGRRNPWAEEQLGKLVDEQERYVGSFNLERNKTELEPIIMEKSKHELLPKVGERLWLDNEHEFRARQALTNDPLLADYARRMHEFGFVRLKNVLSQGVIDDAVAAYKQWCENLDDDPRKIRSDGRNPRVVNLHGDREEFKTLFTSSSELLRVLDHLMGYRASVYTSLTFEYGTEQPLHRDTPVFRTEPEEFYFGVWFALEDADQENGCLQVLSGGHRDGRVDPFEFVKSQGVAPEDIIPSAGALWPPYQDAVVAKCREQGCVQELLPAKKGDVVIWHPQLPHGGSPIRNLQRTRMSAVYHVVPENVPVYQADVFFNPSANVKRESDFEYLHFDGRYFVQKTAEVGEN